MSSEQAGEQQLTSVRPPHPDLSVEKNNLSLNFKQNLLEDGNGVLNC